MLDRIVVKTLQVAAVVLVAAMIVVVCGSVLARVMGTIFYASDELTRLLLSWTVAVGAVLGSREGGHLAVEALVSRTKGRFRNLVLALAGLAVLAFVSILLWAGMRYAMIGFSGSAVTPALGISSGWGQLAWPFAALLMLFTAVKDFVKAVGGIITGKSLEVAAPTDETDVAASS